MSDFRGGVANTPAGPRELTADMRADASHAGRFLRLFGGIWMGVLAPLAAVFGLMGWLDAVAPMGAAFAAGLLVYGLGQVLRLRALSVFERGVETSARITEVFLDTRVRMNKKHPWRVRYAYTAEGSARTATATFWTDHRPEGDVGDELRILYVPGSAGRSVVWSRLALGARVSSAAEATDRVRLDVAPAMGAKASGVEEPPAVASDAEGAATDELAAEEESAPAPAHVAKIADREGDRDSDAKGSA